ncbi:MAG: carbohydrate kinase, partial [Actinobacteria bacterium]|nr:carbohydrate kinase [Actinomycetota bacterium]
ELYKWLSKKSATIVFDPNVRPSIQGDREVYRNSVERWIELSKIVKLSEDDFSWLYENSESQIIANWLSRGTEIVIVTRAERGLSAFTKEGRIDCSAAKVELVDSVGAGDTIGAVIVEGLLKYGLAGLKADALKRVLERAAKAAGEEGS